MINKTSIRKFIEVEVLSIFNRRYRPDPLAFKMGCHCFPQAHLAVYDTTCTNIRGQEKMENMY